MTGLAAELTAKQRDRMTRHAKSVQALLEIEVVDEEEA